MKKIVSAIAVFIMIFSLCACDTEKSPAGGETTQTTTSATADTKEEQVQLSTYPELMDYADYLELTPAQQQEYYESFPDQESYMQWFNDAAQEYNQEQGNNSNNEVEGNVGHVTQPTESQQGQSSKPTEKPTQKPTISSSEEKEPVLLTYAEYLELTPAQQQAYYESFPTPQAYMDWFNAAAKEYNQNNNSTQVEGNAGQVTQSTEPEEDTKRPTSGVKDPGNQAGGVEGFASMGEVDF